MCELDQLGQDRRNTGECSLDLGQEIAELLAEPV
jgi:hypothetical protein